MQHIIPNVTAKYPRLNATYKFDSVEQRSVKCDPLDDGAAYEMQFVMDMDTAKTLHGLCLEAWKNAAAMDTKKRSGRRNPACCHTRKPMMANGWKGQTERRIWHGQS
jgi:hypothetical protein